MEFERKPDIKTTPFTKLYQHLSRKIQLLLFKHTEPSPQLFLLIYTVTYQNLVTITSQLNIFFLLLTIIITYIYEINHYFYYICFLRFDSIYLKSVALILGLAAVNNSNKVWLMLFTLSSYINQECFIFIHLYEAVIGAFICFEIHRNLIFDSKDLNLGYFTGFTCIVGVNIFDFLEEKLLEGDNTMFRRLFLLLVFICSYVEIHRRFQTLKLNKMEKIQHPRQAYFKIQQTNTDFCYCMLSYLQHQKKCRDLECFCHDFKQKEYDENSKQELPKLMTNFMYLYFLKSATWPQGQKIFLIQKYSEFLLQRFRPIKSIAIAHNIFGVEGNYFYRVKRFQIWEKIKQKIGHTNYFMEMRKKYENVFFYDFASAYLRKEILEILTQRAVFWEELIKIQPKTKKLEKIGWALTDRITNLHQFYSQKVPIIEKEIYYYACSFMYASYLYLTTNYSEMAQNILKSIQNRIIDVTKVTAIQVSGVELRLNQQMQKNNDNLFILVITNISQNLAECLHKKKNQLLNLTVTQLIPSHYEIVHLSHFDRWIKKSNFTGQEPSTVVNHYLNVPFKIDSQHIFFSQFQLRLSVHFMSNQLTFQAILYHNESHSINFMTDLSGKVLYKQLDIPLHIFQEPEVFSVIQKMKASYEEYHSLQYQELSIQLQNNAYNFTYNFFFEEALVSNNQEPIIWVKFQDQNCRFDKLLKNKIDLKAQKPGTAFPKDLNEMESQSSIESINDPVKNIIILLENGIWGKHQLPLRIFLLFSVVSSFFVVYLGCYFIRLDQSLLLEESSVLNYEITAYLTNFLSIDKDIRLYQTNETEYREALDAIMLGQDFIEVSSSRIHNMSAYLLDRINSHMFGREDLLTQWKRQIYDHQFTIENFSNPISYFQKPMTLLEIVLEIIVQMRYIQANNFSETLILNKIFYKQILPFLKDINQNSNHIFGQYYSSKTNTILIVLGCSFVFFLLLVFFYIKLLQANRKRNFEIYELFSQIKSTLILRELKKINQTRKNVFGYEENRTEVFSEKFTGRYEKSVSKTSSPMKIQTKYILPESRGDSVRGDQLRIRPADLNNSGSSMDLKRMEFWKSMYLLFMALFFALMLLIMLIKIQNIKDILSIDQEIKFTMRETDIDTEELLLAKIYSDQYELDNRVNFLGTDVEQRLRNSVQLEYKNQGNRKNGVYEAEVQQCSDLKLICEKKHSYSILRGIQKKTIYYTFNEKALLLSAQEQNRLYTPDTNLKKSRSQLFLAQQANQQNLLIMRGLVSNILKKLNDLQKYNFDFHKIAIEIFIGLESAFLLVSILLIVILKRRFMKNTLLLSFFNKQMVYQNKRLQSFVNKIYKEYR